jgi:nucleotide-binding universal stress UspA family protein
MRVLLAIDGSATSDTARELVASFTWPEATIIRVVAVVEPMSAVLVGMPSPYVATEADDAAIVESLERRLAEAAERLAQPGHPVETRLLHGRPASEIVDEASDLRADLIVLGSRGLGPLRSMLLGSVSAEVVDHAPCPVLVARDASIGPVLVAVDGSPTARSAVEHLAGATYLRGHRIHVLSVGPELRGSRPTWAMTMTEPAAMTVEGLVAEDRRRTELQAARAAEELQRSGQDADWTIGAGDPAHEIIEAAAQFGCDLIVMGSRGLTGLDRIRLGSVARNVLLHSPTSVLIVREPVRERASEREAEPVRRRVTQSALSPAG